jgi:2-oxoglutarate dehydrogenase E1 component
MIKSKSYFEQSAALSGLSLSYVDALHEQYLVDSSSIPKSWQMYFDSLEDTQAVSLDSLRDYFSHQGRNRHQNAVQSVPSQTDSWLDAYRRYGHYASRLDPLNLVNPIGHPLLELKAFGLDQNDSSLSCAFPKGSSVDLKAALESVQNLYSQTIGVEYMHIDRCEERAWCMQHFEQLETALPVERKIDILNSLTKSEGMEKFLDRKYKGQKRFSLEGCESLMPLLDTVLFESTALGVEEVAIGMAHRGRLNVMLNIMGMTAEELAEKFSGKINGTTTGDVKYHMGYACKRDIASKKVKISLAFNPSHLETTAAVILGACRSRIDRDDLSSEMVLPIIIHGDAAVAGQGVVMETANMAGTPGFTVGGAIRIVVNNQIGFTTDTSDDRGTHYCTDVFKSIGAPIFHVNADDPIAVCRCARLAAQYRAKFKRDVVIDLIGFRRWGHNEADEPSGTQPMMYKKIAAHAGVRSLFADQMLAEKAVTSAQVEKMIKDCDNSLNLGSALTETLERHAIEKSLDKKHAWHPYIQGKWTDPAKTAFSRKRFVELAKRYHALSLQDDLQLQRQVQNLMQQRQKMTAGEIPLRWGYAELMAYATLMDQGFNVRLIGQDSGRGTFAHRHVVLRDQRTGQKVIPHQHLFAADENSAKKGKFHVYDSVLTEQAVLAYEYGYAISSPKTLLIWEAQFGDFCNGAQVVIDQFISSGWQKWQRLCGLVLFLPHGQEGMGPEHSSARLERFLQLTAQYNIQVCVPSHAGQIFHLLRRQMLRNFRKPLVIMTPKSLLRKPEAMCQLDDLINGKFHCVIPENKHTDAKKIKRVVLCSGKIYFELLAKRAELGMQDIALIRIEQLYPFPYEDLKNILAQYTSEVSWVWCQEEPKNQGAWYAKRHCMEKCLPENAHLYYAGRGTFAAPAVGYPALHREQQERVINEALGLIQGSTEEEE